MRKGASRIAVGAFSRGRWYPNIPPERRELSLSPAEELKVSLVTQEAKCAIFTRHKCAIFVRR